MGEKRGSHSNHYDNGRGQSENKKQKPNGSDSKQSYSPQAKPRHSRSLLSPSHFSNSKSNTNTVPSNARSNTALYVHKDRRGGSSNGVWSGYHSKHRNGIHNGHHRSQKEKSAIEEALAQFPDPKDCPPCKRAATEMQTGLISLLDQLSQEEAGPAGNQNILHHARELRKLLFTRASQSSPSKPKQELDRKQPEAVKYVTVPPYIDRLIEKSANLPPLPLITEPSLQKAVFTHRSANFGNRVRGANGDEINYERLEFLGDSYLEIISSRLIYSRFPHLEGGQQSQLRESLVKNDKLAEFSEAYNLGARLDHVGHMGTEKHKTKILADVFEAYVAAVILSDPVNGFTTVESWLTDLWAPQLLAHNPRTLQNHLAREELQKLIGAKGVKVEYKEEQKMEMVNGVHKFFMGVYLTGWGYEEKWLGSASGQNKAAASLAAAIDALQRSKTVLDDCHRQKLEMYANMDREQEKHMNR
ncbi:ribonuclease III [Lojkania enalia]|uniref:ribonuclease III n=1 Tax=Lojkania enalia TaxID=147567 RepID=A0A9P4KFF7_9PLEO|nr:ribonuclease III [Didymosphaeria enalia]